MGISHLGRTAWARLTTYDGSEVVLTGNWGAAPTVAVTFGSNDQRGQVTVTPDAGSSGTVGWALTFRDGAWETAPFVIVFREGQGAGQPGIAVSKTGIAVTHNGTIGTGVPIVYDYLVMG